MTPFPISPMGEGWEGGIILKIKNAITLQMQRFK
jgi:hypothetical protein